MEEKTTGNRQQATGDGQQAMSERGLRRGANIAERLLVFGAGVIKVASRLPRDRIGRHVADQHVRAATSAGANYEEARAAESTSDFVHKIRIAAKEIREASYWTNLVLRSGWIKVEGLPQLADEALQLAAILGASARTARARSRASASSD
jgi:four helix bundle protein